MRNKNLYEEKIKSALLDLVNHEKIKDVKIFLSKILKKIIQNDKNCLYKDETIHKICFLLKKENIPVINNIFNDVVINYIEYKEEKSDLKNNSIKKEKYFKGDNEFFIKEFKIELEKKTSILNKKPSNVLKDDNKEKNINEEKTEDEKNH